VATALSGDAAWSLAQQRLPDLVVLDLAIPGGDGFWLAERFRRDPRLRDLPIVAYTALDLDADEQERLRQLRVELLMKSRADPGVLEARVLHLLSAAPGGES
jgi:CheY-like chemotaxis protein